MLLVACRQYSIGPLHFVDATDDPAHTNAMRVSAVEYTVGKTTPKAA
jgi:hypothetical protein